MPGYLSATGFVRILLWTSMQNSLTKFQWPVRLFFLDHGPVILYLLLIFTSLMPPHFLIPLNSKRDKHLTSPNRITPESNIKVMRIKRNDCKLKKLLIVGKILLKITEEVWRTKILMLLLKEMSVRIFLSCRC